MKVKSYFDYFRFLLYAYTSGNIHQKAGNKRSFRLVASFMTLTQTDWATQLLASFYMLTNSIFFQSTYLNFSFTEIVKHFTVCILPSTGVRAALWLATLVQCKFSSLWNRPQRAGPPTVWFPALRNGFLPRGLYLWHWRNWGQRYGQHIVLINVCINGGTFYSLVQPLLTRVCF